MKSWNTKLDWAEFAVLELIIFWPISLLRFDFFIRKGKNENDLEKTHAVFVYNYTNQNAVSHFILH